MIGELLLAKKKLVLNLTKNASRYIDEYYDEIGIWDEEFIKAYFNRTREVYIKLCNDNEDGRYNKEIRNLKEEMILLSSNSFENLEFAIKLSQSIDGYFLEALEGLNYYKNGYKDKSYEKFLSYMKSRTYNLNHYLVNKTFGVLLYENKRYNEALNFLNIAIEKRPTDIEIYRLLMEIYNIKNLIQEKIIIEEIIKVIEG